MIKKHAMVGVVISSLLFIAPVVAFAYDDGSTNAPAGVSAQHPTLFTGYATRPTWKVAGVDYGVGIPAGTVLKDPSVQTNLPSCAAADTTNHIVRIQANNCTLDGYDFSLHGGWGVYIQSPNAGSRILHSNFLVNSTSPIPVSAESGTSNTYVGYNTIDDNGINGNVSFGETLSIYNGATVEYNWIKNAPQHFLSVGNGGVVVYRYNLLEEGAMSPGAHLNFIQYGGGNFTNNQVIFNTMLQHKQVAGGEGVQMYTNTTGTITNGEVGNNTIIAYPTSDPNNPSMSYILHLGSNGQYAGSYSGTAHDNYMADAGNGAFGFIYGGLTGFTYANNIDLVTNKLINSDNSESPITIGPKTYYVDSVNGNDTNAGTSTALPWKTLAKVYNSHTSFLPGDSILLMRGDTWTETFNIANQSGAVGSPIIYGAYGIGAAPVIDAQNARTYAVYVDNASHITINDLKVVNATADGLHIIGNSGDAIDILVQRIVSERNSRHGFDVDAKPGVTHADAITYRNDQANLNGQAGFHAYNVSDGATGINYYNSKATYNGQLQANHGFSAYYSNNIHYHNVEAAFTNIDPATGNPNALTGEGIGIVFDDFTNNSSVEGSYSHDNAGAGMAVAHQGSNNTASYNVVSRNKGQGIVVNGSTAGSNNVQIFGNTIDGNGGYGIQVWQPVNTISIKNNIVSNNTGYGIGFSSTGISSSVVANNVLFSNTLGTTAYVTGATGTITSDPKFTNAASNDYSLQSGSPAIDAGANLGAVYQMGLAPGSTWPNSVSTLNQNSYGAGWDMGAFVSTATSQPNQPTATLSANPTTITSGQSSTLAWSSTNATSCTGTNFTASATAGTVTVSPTVTTTYGVTCTGTGGSANASATVTVTTQPPTTTNSSSVIALPPPTK
jgi:hypothetical protein